MTNLKWEDMKNQSRYPAMDLKYTINVKQPLEKDPEMSGCYLIRANDGVRTVLLRLWESTFMQVYDHVEANNFKDVSVIFYRPKDSKRTLVKLA